MALTRENVHQDFDDLATMMFNDTDTTRDNAQKSRWTDSPKDPEPKQIVCFLLM